MKIAHVVPSLAGAGAGPAYAVSRLTRSLADLHVQVQVQTLIPVPEQSSNDCCVIGYPLNPVLRRLGISSDMRRALVAIDADILHNNGVWMMPNIYTGIVARKRGLPLVFSPHGMFSEWAMAYSRLRKQVAWWCLGQRRAVTATACFHATSASEAEDIRRLDFRQPIAVIPNGVDLPDLESATVSRKGRRTMLFLSRIHPKKGIAVLLRAWRRVERHHPGWDLVVAGPDEGGHLAAMRALARALALERVSFPGSAHGPDKQALYRRADVFVLPSHSENFGLVVAEALAWGLPVIATTGTPWQDLERRACGWWIELSEGDLAEAMQAAMTLPEQRRLEMGRRGRLWMEQSFGWPGIASEMRSVYQWILGGGPPPACVLTR